MVQQNLDFPWVTDYDEAGSSERECGPPKPCPHLEGEGKTGHLWGVLRVHPRLLGPDG